MDVIQNGRLAFFERFEPSKVCAGNSLLHELSRVIASIRDIVSRKELFGEWLWQFGGGLVGCRPFPGQFGGGRATEPEREDRFAAHAIQQQRVAELGDLRDGVDPFAVASDGNKIRGSWNIEIPNIMADFLEMPQAAPGAGIQREHAVGE